MISKQYSMSADSITKFKEIKETSLYKDYINTIINSPTLLNIANEHIKNIDMTDDIDELISKSHTSAKKLNTLFKDTLKNMAINIVADTLIIKDITDLGFDDAVDELEDNFKVKYLLGLADEEYYKRAEKVIEENPDTSSIVYMGYVEYKKRKETDTLNKMNISEISKINKPAAKTRSTKKETKAKTKKLDFNSTDIEF